MKRLLLFFILLFSVFVAKSQVYDSLKVSLLTVKPRPNEVYTIYGHTALRLCDPVSNTDVVFNWGMFNFNAPNFLYRFVKGETDYYLAAEAYKEFIFSYTWGNATVLEQVLTIPDENKEALIEMLMLNLEPKNREYRYNFLFDNCTTRPRDIIEKICGGKLIYPEKKQKTTYRELIHSCTNPYPWMAFGIDLVIGSGADSLISQRSELFLPTKLMDTLDRSTVTTGNGDEHPIVASSQTLLQSTDNTPPTLKFQDSPLKVGFLVFFLYLALVIAGYIKKRKFWIPLALLFLIAGVGGCIVVFLSFFSVHPCTGHNWNILWLHPLHFIGCAGYFFKKPHSLFRWYHGFNFVLLSVLLLAWYLVPQQLNPANIPFILCMIMASGYSYYFLKKGKNE
jgi:hypothetical protein